MPPPLRRAPLRVLALALVAAAAAPAARADVSAQVEGDNATATTTTRDAAGTESKADSVAWTQRYRLALEEKLAPLVTFSGAGLLDWTSASSKTNGLRTDSDTKKWDGNAHLRLGTPVLGGGL